MERLVIIDGNSLLFRAYFAMRPMVTKAGVYTNGIYGFINMLNKIKSDYEPDMIAVAFDVKEKTFRHEMYDGYKAGRAKTPVELLSQIPKLHEVLEAMNITVLELAGYEADDILGTLSARAEKSGIETYIITGDRDALQLVDNNTRVVINKKGMTEFELYDRDAMQERYGLTPKQFIDLKALMGDSSDNIPGVAGIGEKKGIALLEQYGTLESVLDHADEIKGKMGETLRSSKDVAMMSKELATIYREVPLDVDFNDLRDMQPDLNKLIDVYKDLEFNSFITRLGKTEEIEDDSSGRIIEDLSSVKDVDFNELLTSSGTGTELLIKAISSNDHVNDPELTGIAVYAPDKGLYSFKPLTLFDAEAAIMTLSEAAPAVSGCDLKSSLYPLMKYGFSGFTVSHDAEIAEYLIDPNRSKYDIRKMATKYLGFIWDEDYEDQTKLELYITGLVNTKQAERLKSEGLTDLFENCEIPLIETITSMEIDGIKVDRDILIQTGKELDASIADLTGKIYELAGTEFNINSPKQLGKVLFEDMMLPYPANKKSGSYSTSADILDKLAEEHEIVALVLDFRKKSKLKSTYIDGLLALIGPDGKIHPHFNQTVAATGRLSCTEPNLQNIPIRDDYGRGIRKAFVTSAPGNVFVGADYSQIELRIMASLSGDEGLIESFNKGEDIHRSTAARVFGIPMDEVTPLDRTKAKAVNFGVIYGMSGFGLSENLSVTRKEAQKYIDDYFEKHKAVKDFLDEQVRTGEEKKEVRTLFGRLRQIPEFSSGKYMERQLAARLAMNTPIQGTAADIIKIAMNKVYAELKDRGMRSRLILQIHDELIIEAVPDEKDAVIELLDRNMRSAAELKVELITDIHSGTTWYDLK
jgi:DNA polymerase-1